MDDSQIPNVVDTKDRMDMPTSPILDNRIEEDGSEPAFLADESHQSLSTMDKGVDACDRQIMPPWDTIVDACHQSKDSLPLPVSTTFHLPIQLLLFLRTCTSCCKMHLTL